MIACPCFFLYLFFFGGGGGGGASHQVKESLVYFPSPHLLTRCLICLQCLATAMHFIKVHVAVLILFLKCCFSESGSTFVYRPGEMQSEAFISKR